MSYKYPHHSEAVRDFTEARLGRPVPNEPRALSETSIRKYIGLCMSELVEMARTVTTSNTAAHQLVKECLGMDPPKIEHEFPTDVDVIAAQADAAVDLEYYSRDIFNEHGINLDSVFDEVHDANMLKKFPDGTFHTQELAPGIFKVIKPPGWMDLGVPDINGVIATAMVNGSWPNQRPSSASPDVDLTASFAGIVPKKFD